MDGVGEMAVEEESFDHGVADANGGVLNALEEIPAMGEAAMEWV